MRYQVSLTGLYTRNNEILTSLSVRVDKTADDKVLRVEVTPVRHCKRLVCDRVPDRPPHVDNADTSLQETFSVFAEMAVDPLDTGLVGLVDVYTLDWAAQLCVAVGVVSWLATV